MFKFRISLIKYLKVSKGSWFDAGLRKIVMEYCNSDMEEKSYGSICFEYLCAPRKPLLWPLGLGPGIFKVGYLILLNDVQWLTTNVNCCYNIDQKEVCFPVFKYPTAISFCIWKFLMQSTFYHCEPVSSLLD